MSSSCFADRIGRLAVLTDDERAGLMALEERCRPLRRGATLFRERDPAGELFIVCKGMLMSYVLLDDGSRQILRFLFPGDMIGTIAYDRAPEAVVALNESNVCPFDRSALAALMTAHPRVAALILVNSQIERVALTDRLAALGRSSAKARVAALLLELRDRQRMVQPALGATFHPGLTQEEMGDATGLTAVHVNRMLRQLEEEALIERANGWVTILDQRALAVAANYVDRYADFDLGWLPPPA